MVFRIMSCLFGAKARSEGPRGNRALQGNAGRNHVLLQ